MTQLEFKSQQKTLTLTLYVSMTYSLVSNSAT